MTPQAFVAGLVRLETSYLKLKLTEKDRQLYQAALVDLTDAQWAKVVDYVLKAWQYHGRMPSPAQFLEWSGIKVDTPAEAAQRTIFDGDRAALNGVLNEAANTGSGPRSWFWKDTTEQLAYEYAAEEVQAAAPAGSFESVDAVLGRIRLISERAQAQLARVGKETR